MVMTASDVCRLVEGNEARAYAALVESASALVREQGGLCVQRVGGAYAFVAGGVRDSLLLNRVIGLGVWEPLTHVQVEELDDLYRENGVATYAVEMAPSGVAGLTAVDLQSTGFVPFKQTTLMYRDSESPLMPSSELDVRGVDSAYADTFAALCCSVFGFADPFRDLLRSSFQHPHLKHWMAFDGEEAAAAAMTAEFEDGSAWIGWVCTLPGYRGRGAQSALAAAQLRQCLHRGLGCVTLEAATGTKRRPGQSLRNYSRLGWTAAYDRLVLLRRMPI